MSDAADTNRFSMEKPSRPAVVDVDRHVQETWKIFQEYAEPQFRDRVFKKVTLPDGSARIAIDNRPMPFSAAMWDDPAANQMFEDGRFAPNDPAIKDFDLTSYLAAMDREGIDAAIVTPTLAMGGASIPDGQLGSAVFRAYGRWIHEFCSTARHRLLPFYPVNLYDVEQAVKDGRWAVEEMQFRGFMVIALPIGTRNLHLPEFEPFWAMVQDLDVPVQVHTLSSLPDAQGRGPLVELVSGVNQFGGNIFFHHLISHRFEQHLMMASIVAGGVLERFPRVRVLFVEAGGGWVASWLEKMDSHYHAPQMRKWVPWLTMEPSAYVRRQCLVAFNADEFAIGLYAPLIGSDHVAWSSDYPHHDGVYPGAVDAVRRSIAPLSDREQANILGGNAARFCKLV